MPSGNAERPTATEATDWNAVRAAALDSLNAIWSLVLWANRSLWHDYDDESAALHLAAIETALNTFRRAREIVQPGLECATVDALRHSPVFDALALASVGEGPRPDFGICATAHEKAFELLRAAILWVENGLNDELERRGAPDNVLEGIDDLGKRSPQQLRVSLQDLEKKQSLQSILSVRHLNELRAWVDREWAAVVVKQSRADSKVRSGASKRAGRPKGASLSKDEKECLDNYLAGKKPSEIDKMMMERLGSKRKDGTEWQWGTASRVIEAAKARREIPRKSRNAVSQEPTL